MLKLLLAEQLSLYVSVISIPLGEDAVKGASEPSLGVCEWDLTLREKPEEAVEE